VANARHAGQVRARLVAAALHPSCASKDSCIECLNNVGAFGPPALAGAVSLILAESAVCLQPLQLLTVFAHAVGAVGVLYSSNLPDTLQCRSAHLCPDIRGCAVHVRYIAHIAPSRGGCTVCSACADWRMPTTHSSLLGRARRSHRASRSSMCTEGAPWTAAQGARRTHETMPR
jgi:hypothetical protein